MGGLVVGLSIGLAGVGMSMTDSILNFANFGHVDYVTSGALAGWAVTWLFAGAGQFDAATLLFIGSVSRTELAVSIVSTPFAVALDSPVNGVVGSLGSGRCCSRCSRICGFRSSPPAPTGSA